MTSPQSKRKVLLYHSTALHERLVYHIFRKFDDSVLESVCDTSEITHIYRQLHKHATALEDTIRTFLPQMRSHNSQRERVAAVFFEKNIIDVMSNMLHITKKTVETQETAEVVFGEDAQDKTNASDLKETADRYWNVSILGRDLVSIAMALEKEEEVVLQDSYIFLSPANEEEFIASGRLITRDNFKKFELSGGEKEKIVMANGLERVISVPGIESLYFWVTAEGNISIDKLDPNLILELLAPQQYEALRMHILYALCGYMNAEYRVLPPREALKKSSGCSTEPSTDSEDNSAVLIPRTKRTIRPQDGEKPPPESQITRNLKKRDSHSRILYNGGMPGKKAFEKAQANKRVELWAWVEDPNAQNPDDIITPLERIDTHPNYLAFLDWAHELRETHRAKHPEKRVLFQTYIKAFRKDETVAPVQERVTEVLSRGKG